jgi:hypothetical protein
VSTSSGRSKLRSAVVTLAVAALTVVGAATIVQGTTAGGAVAQASSVEFDGADCPVPNPGSTNNSLLPDPFTKIDGSRITTKNEWRCRRAEIKELAEQTVYGQKPDPPDSVTGTVTSSNITVNVSDNGQSTSFSASVQLPGGSGPFPAVIVYGGFGADTNTILQNGAAVVSYSATTVGAEGTGRSNKSGAFYSLYGSSSSTGLLAAWAWGVSRIIDVIEQSGGNILRADIGVTGCSRFGKGAFVAGAFDQRIDLTMPVESGSAGVPIFRGIAQEGGAQPLSSAYGEQPWLGDAFGSFTSNPSGLPVDTHEVVGMIAPRGLFVMENPHIDWLAAQSGANAALAGREIYTALGARENISYISNVSNGNHCATRGEWQTPMAQSIQRFLHGSGSAPGTFSISPNKPGNLGQWRNWSTPTLVDGPSSPPPSSAPPSSAPPSSAPPSSAPPSSAPPSSAPPSSPPPPSGSCSATYTVVNEWPGGFQAEVVVTAGSGGLNGWTVGWTFTGGQSITQIWNGSASGSGGAVTVSNVSYNGTVPPNGSTSFGFLGSQNGNNPVPSPITCG